MGPGQVPRMTDFTNNYQLFYQNPSTGAYFLSDNSPDLPQMTQEFPLDLYPLVFMLPKSGKVLLIAGHSSVIYDMPGQGYMTPSTLPTETIPKLEVSVNYPQSATAVLLTLEPSKQFVPTVRYSDISPGVPVAGPLPLCSCLPALLLRGSSGTRAIDLLLGMMLLPRHFMTASLTVGRSQ